MTRKAMVAVLLLMLPLGCATRSPARRHRSLADADERLAAQRRADPHLRAEEMEYRFGFEKAQQRKRLRKPAPAKQAPGAAPADVTKSKKQP